MLSRCVGGEMHVLYPRPSFETAAKKGGLLRMRSSFFERIILEREI
jgi:hypothetical protein